jgi:hypothetical protein
MDRPDRGDNLRGWGARWMAAPTREPIRSRRMAYQDSACARMASTDAHAEDDACAHTLPTGCVHHLRIDVHAAHDVHSHAVSTGCEHQGTRDACGYADSIAEAPTAPSGYGSVAISGECPITDEVATSSQVNSSQKRLNYSSTLEHKCLRGTCVVLKQCICSPNGLQT